MARVGIVGGLGPESTIDYYRRILETWAQDDASTVPSIVIDSLDVQRALALVENDRPGLTEYLLASLRRLAGAGVDFAAMTANTPHIVFDELAVRSPVPLLSIVEVCAEQARQRGLRRLALLGTRFTMEGPFYPEVCARYGIDVVQPREADRAWVHERYIGELLKGEFRDDTRQRFVSLVTRLRDEERIDAVILGGTELPLLLPAPAIAGLPALDTTALHVAAIVKRLREANAAVVHEPRDAVAIRHWKKDDREAVALLANDRRIWVNLRDGFPHPYGLEDADRFITMAQGMAPETYFAIEADGAVAGGIGYTLHKDIERIAAEVGYWVGVPFWGKGIATRAVQLITETAFSRHRELRRLYAVPLTSNPASSRVLEKAGYEREALLRQSVIKDGVVRDQWMYARLRAD